MDLKWFAIALFCVSVHGLPNTREDAFQLTKKALTEYLDTGKRPAYLEYALQQYQLPGLFRSEPDTFDDAQVCTLCNIVASLLILERRNGMTDDQLAAEASFFCDTFGVETKRVCDGLINSNLKVFTYIVDNNPNLNGQRICALLLQSDCNPGDNFDWTVDIPEGATIAKTNATGLNKFNILHISDIHYDPLYTPGKSSRCGEPLCCQIDQPDGTSESDSCGYWTDYRDADVPLHLIHETLKQTNIHSFDYVYYTGDFVSHRVWSTSVANNTRDITIVTDAFKQYYSVPVYPVLGNHEPHPVNIWSSDGVSDIQISTQWLFDLVAEEWSDWLTEEAKSTILKGGYYTLSPRQGFRVIVLNSNVCYIVNWWLLNEDKDPYGQLAWLAETLLGAEENKESVHILYHVPTGNSACLKVWSREYSRIVERFANTITGQFNGHTHKDQISIYYSNSDESPINIAWNGASVTPFSNSNPSFKLYQIDDGTFSVFDYEEWTFNLTLANLNYEKDVDWYKLYSFRDAYGVKSLEPSEVHDLVNRMTTDHTLIQKYYNFKFRNSDVAVKAGCDATCEKNLICDMVTPVYGQNDICDKMVKIYEES